MDIVPVRRLWLAVLCGYLCLGATLQALPPFVTRDLHGGTVAAATAVGVAFAATAVTRPFAGRAADAGRARPVVIAGGLLGAAGGLGHLFAPNVPVLLIARLVMGAGEGALLSGALPWVLAATPSERRGRSAGWFGLSMWGGLAAGPVVAVGLRAWGGFDAVWYGVAALGGAAALLVVCTGAQRPIVDRPSVLPKRWRDLVPTGAPLPGLVLGLSAYGYGTVGALLLLRLEDAAFGGERVALAVFAVSFLLVRLAGSPLVDRWGGGLVVAASLAVEAAGLLLVAAAPTAWATLVGTSLTGAGVALMFPGTVALTLHRTGPLRPGAAVGVMTSFWDLGIMVAAPLGGLIAANGTYSWSFAVAAGVALSAAPLVAGISKARTHRFDDTRDGTAPAP